MRKKNLVVVEVSTVHAISEKSATEYVMQCMLRKDSLVNDEFTRREGTQITKVAVKGYNRMTTGLRAAAAQAKKALQDIDGQKV